MSLHLTTRFFPSGFAGTGEERRQMVILIRSVLLTTLFTLSYIGLCALTNLRPGVYLMVANAAAYLTLLMLLKTGRATYRQAAYAFVLGGTGFVTLTAFYSGAFRSDVTIWLIAMPLVGALLLGRQGGFIVTATTLLCLAGLWYLQYRQVAVTNYLNPAYELLFRLQVLGGLILIILVIALVFADATVRALQSVEEKNNQLLLQSRQLQQSLDDLKATQAQLIHAGKLASLGELTAGIAHEIQNPLNFVNNFAELSAELAGELQEGVAGGNATLVKTLADNLRENMQHIVQSGQRASNIVRSMLEHARVDSGYWQLTDLNALADEYLRLSYQGLRARHKEVRVHVETRFDPAVSPVNVVPQDISRVLLNLFNNAFYAVSEKAGRRPAGYEPTVRVRTQRLAQEVKITVYDNGTGIPEAIRHKIFQPFFTTKPTGQGTGLGLSMSYDIITNGHKGQLQVHTQEEAFTEFHICLPINQAGA